MKIIDSYYRCSNWPIKELDSKRFIPDMKSCWKCNWQGWSMDYLEYFEINYENP